MTQRKQTSLKKRFALALLLIKMIYVAIFEGIWFLLSSKAKKLVGSLFKTPSSKIGFYCVALMSLPIIVFAIVSFQDSAANIQPDSKYDVFRTIVLYIVIVSWLIFIAMAVSGRHQSHIVQILEAELANEQDESKLLAKVCFFSGKAMISRPTVYLTNKPYATAISVNRLHGDSIMIFNSEILKLLDEDELDCVIAHEVCHVKHRDSILNAALFFTFHLAFVLLWQMSLKPINVVREYWKGVKSSYRSHERLLYSLGLAVSFVMGVCALIVGIPIRNIFREQELRADVWSSAVTNNPVALKSAISKLAAFIQMHKDYPSRLWGVFNIVEPLPCGWVQEKRFRFVYPRNAYRMHMLSVLDEMGIVSKPKQNEQ